MEENYKTPVTNTTRNDIAVILPDIKFRRIWNKFSTFKVPLEVLREAMYDTGFMHFINEGTLYIEEEAVRIELGLEEPGISSNIVIYSEGKLMEILNKSSLSEFNDLIESMTKDQVLTLIDLAIAQKAIDFSKSESLKRKSGIDTVKAIQLKIQDEEKE